MHQRDLEITIGPDGKVELTVRGHKGRGCEDIARMFERIVGELVSQRRTSEYYEPDEHVRFNQQQRR